MQLLQFNICHFNVSNADTMSTENDYRGIFNVIKVLLSSFVIQVMYENFNLVYLIDTDIWHELHRIKWEYFMQGYCEKQGYIAVKHFVLYIISTNKKENKTAHLCVCVHIIWF